MKRILFNATHAEELRVAIVDGQKLLNLDIESAARCERKGNIYKGIITRIEPSLEACFIDYGAPRQGFLPLKDVSRLHFNNRGGGAQGNRARIQDVLREGQELTVQVEKDERGTKGAALTTFISLAGRFLVLMPDNPKGGGISRRVAGDERSELRDIMARLNVPDEYSVIVRTAGIGQNYEELQWDLDFLMQLWDTIKQATDSRNAPFLVFQESNLVVRAIRDYLRTDISEILIDDPEIFERASRFVKQVMPQSIDKLKLHEDHVPLFSRFQIEHQIESAFSRDMRLPSGGALVIDQTEAVVTIDVNSAHATKGGSIEETALQTNLEAADEIARQLRIRDLGGLIVIDLIDMVNARHQRQVENRLNEALKHDRARTQTGRISRFGLLEMSRQRLRPALGETNYMSCPHCNGCGMIRTVPSSALSILRILEEEALKEGTGVIHAYLPLETASFLLNEKRAELGAIEQRLGSRLTIVPSPSLQVPAFQVERLSGDTMSATSDVPSYELKAGEQTEDSPPPRRGGQRAAASAAHAPQAERQPVVNMQDLNFGAPPSRRTPGWFTKLWRTLSGAGGGTKKKPAKKGAGHKRKRTAGSRRSTETSRRGAEASRRSAETSRRGAEASRRGEASSRRGAGAQTGAGTQTRDGARSSRGRRGSAAQQQDGGETRARTARGGGTESGGGEQAQGARRSRRGGSGRRRPAARTEQEGYEGQEGREEHRGHEGHDEQEHTAPPTRGRRAPQSQGNMGDPTADDTAQNSQWHNDEAMELPELQEPQAPPRGTPRAPKTQGQGGYEPPPAGAGGEQPPASGRPEPFEEAQAPGYGDDDYDDARPATDRTHGAALKPRTYKASTLAEPGLSEVKPEPETRPEPEARPIPEAKPEPEARPEPEAKPEHGQATPSLAGRRRRPPKPPQEDTTSKTTERSAGVHFTPPSGGSSTSHRHSGRDSARDTARDEPPMPEYDDEPHYNDRGNNNDSEDRPMPGNEALSPERPKKEKDGNR